MTAHPDPMTRLQRADASTREMIERPEVDAAMTELRHSIGNERERLQTSLDARGETSTTRGRRRPRFPARALAAGSAVALVLAFTGLVTPAMFGPSAGVRDAVPGPEQAWSAPAIRVAEAAPRLLITLPGWSVTGADQFSGEEGQMSFSDGDLTIDLTWAPRSLHDHYVEDRRLGTDALKQATVNGAPAVLFLYQDLAGNPQHRFTALWLEGNHTVELQTGSKTIQAGADAPLMTEVRFRGILAAVRRVSVTRWLKAMPADIVLPANNESAVKALLRGADVPPGFDIPVLWDGAAVRNEQTLAAQISRRLLCGWARAWVQADSTDDRAAARQAARAFRRSPFWPVTQRAPGKPGRDEIERTAAIADAMDRDGTFTEGRERFRVQDIYKTWWCEETSSTA